MIQRVLVANRGEIACRILRACREAGLSSVAIYAENDREGMFRELADESVLLEGDTIAETYLNGAAIIQAGDVCQVRCRNLHERLWTDGVL